VAMVYFLCSIDQVNIGLFSGLFSGLCTINILITIGNARLAGLEKGLGLVWYDYNM
jgi:hypothetical protein